jgi:hypothetical protein
MIRIMEKGEIFKKTYIPTSLYLRFPKGDISQQGRTASIQRKCFGLQESDFPTD